MRDPLYNDPRRVVRRQARLIRTAIAIALSATILLPTRPSAGPASAGDEKHTPTTVAHRLAAAESGTVSRGKLISSASEATHSIVVGNPNGDVSLVEFFDYNCDYCRDSAKHVRELLRTDSNLRLVLRSFPLHGAASSEAAQVTWAVGRLAGAQRAYEFHTRLMDSRGPLDGPRALTVAAQMGFDATRLRQLMNDDVGQRAAEDNLRLAQRLGLTGTPAFIVGGDIVLGAVGVDRLRRAITNARR